jgi:hypothetical protein
VEVTSNSIDIIGLIAEKPDFAAPVVMPDIDPTKRADGPPKHDALGSRCMT